MCYSAKCSVLFALCYFAVSGWQVVPGSHDGQRPKYDDWSSHTGSSARNCDILAKALDRLTANDVRSHLPSRKTFVSDLEICNNQKTSCCTKDAEDRLHRGAVEATRESLHLAMTYLSQFLADNYLHYQDQFITMLSAAENETEEVLNSVYKINQPEWKSCLGELFIDLSAYLQHENGDIAESLTKFYNQLFPIIFQYVLNDPSVVNLDLTYRECLMEARQDLSPQPFGDAPTKLAREMTESLRATRTFLSSLALAAELMNLTAEFPFDKQCTRALTRLEYCSLCEGIDGTRSCRAFCQNIMRGCLSGVVSLEGQWDLLVDRLQVLCGSMKGSRDVEEVLRLFPTRVSESVMHSMETAHKYYEKIVLACGHPKTFERHNFTEYAQPSHRQLPSFHEKAHNHQPKLHSKIEMMMRNVVASKGFLSKLPDSLCNSNRFPLENCWNGTALGLYKRHVTANVLAAQIADNPEMKVVSTQSPVISTLQKKIDNLQKVLAGFVGDDELMQSDMASYDQFEGSGSFNYRKNGYGSKGVDDSFSDDEDINVDASGSGDYDSRERPIYTKNRLPDQNVPDVRDDGDDFEDYDRVTTRKPPYITKAHQPRPPSFNAASRRTFVADQFMCHSLMFLTLMGVELW